MNLRPIVKLSNIVAAVSIILLIYWVFIFVVTQVFGFRIFRENISETFSMSILGILALMFGSLMINIMFNLTRIAEKHNLDKVKENGGISKRLGLGLILSFPIIFVLLFGGDYLTSKKKEQMLIQSARSIISSSSVKVDRFLSYEFTSAWINESKDTLGLFAKMDKGFPNVSVIVKDSIDSTNVFLGFRNYYDPIDPAKQPQKQTYVFQTTKEERDYLNKVFDEAFTEARFTAHDGQYELYFPYIKDGKKVVLYFSDFQRYGKLGSS